MTNATDFILLNTLLNTKLQKGVEGQLSLHGISFTEFMIMHQLMQAPNHTLRRIELADQISITASGVTRVLAPMEKIKLVEKQANPRDARVSLVKLTEAGERIYTEALVSFEHSAESLMSNVSAGQLDEMLKLSGKLL
ncbi:hypothetical protein GCM10009133_19020 [Cocleimonas flava]|uniref:MarR family transcriptional regulator n=1 Tax=Cocleimonas flava TaxID=634765 RepID=A0A4R1ET80_9GAMM|nr:MarR family transcriptional regulator [Cocleimonas flava]TCJ84826.1 MarR family transcriptional regulator [Cocleimonas flava]